MWKFVLVIVFLFTFDYTVDGQSPTLQAACNGAQAIDRDLNQMNRLVGQNVINIGRILQNVTSVLANSAMGTAQRVIRLVANFMVLPLSAITRLRVRRQVERNLANLRNYAYRANPFLFRKRTT